MPEWNELRQAKNLDDLKKQATISEDKLKQHIKDEKRFFNNMKKCWQFYEEKKVLRDQENCYVYLFKFIQFYSYYQSFGSDEKFARLYFGKAIHNGMTELESLDNELRERYKVLELKKSNGILVSNESVKTSEQKKEVNGSFNQNKVLERNTSRGIKFKSGSFFIDCKELKELLEISSPLTVLIIDVRSEKEFQSRVKSANNINIPSKILIKGDTAAIIEKKLPDEAKSLWIRRGDFEYIVLMDRDTNVQRYKDGIPIYLIREILTEWDYPTKYKNEPLILNNGFNAWCDLYPNLTVNPGYHKMFNCIDVQPATVVLNDISYPDSDEESKKQNEVNKIVNVPSNPSIEDDKNEKVMHTPSPTTNPVPSLAPTGPSSKCPRVDRSSKPNLEVKPSLNTRKPLKNIHDSSVSHVPMKEDSIEDDITKLDDADIVRNKVSTESYILDSSLTSGNKENHAPMNDESKRENWKVDSEITHVSLKSDSVGSPGLKKSLSSPNISQLGDNMEVLISKTTPTFDRSNKPTYLSPADSPRHGYQDKQYKGPSQNELEGAVFGANIIRGLSGLKNLGNTCYMNSILQCISNTTALREELCRFSAGESLKNHKSKTEGLIAREIQKVVRILWMGNTKYFSCKDLKTVVGKFRNSFRGSEQQDSHEFFTILMDWLHEDLNEPSPNGDLFGAAEETGEKAWGEFRKNNNSIVLDLFYGQQKSTVRCNECGKQSVTFEPFSNLSLLLPSSEDSCALSDCLDLYLKQESISGWNCPKCKTSQNATKKVDITRLPPVLVIHFKRFTSNGWCRKKQTFVNFPLGGLDMRGYSTKNSEQRNQVYSLYAVSNHYGTMESGHYTAYCLNTVTNSWYKFDDQDVSDISPNDVKTSAAYILFYSVKR